MEAKLSRRAAGLIEYGRPVVLVSGGLPHWLHTLMELAAHHSGRLTKDQSELASR